MKSDTPEMEQLLRELENLRKENKCFQHDNELLRQKNAALREKNNSLQKHALDLESANRRLEHDVGKAKKAQTQLKKARRKAEESAKAQSDYLANMSHEIRTPLNAILGITDLVLSDFDSDHVKANIERIKDAGLSLFETISDILDYSKIQARMQEYETSDFCPRELVHHAVSQHEFQARRKGLTLGMELAAELPDALHGNETFLRQIIHNLLANAIKFTQAGSVTVNAKLGDAVLPATDDPAAQHQTVGFVLEISDTGIGIPPADQKRIFNSFTQADETIARRFGGTGLGLAICRHLAHHMDGELSVSSEPGKGSVFRVEVPLQVADSPLQEAFDSVASISLPAPTPQTDSMSTNRLDLDTLRTPQLSPLDILIVEDNALNRDLLRIFFTGRHHRVTCASDGMIALDLLKKNVFDIILMDIQMPELDGMETTKRIRAASGLACPENIPIIALTAHAIEGDRDRFLQSGMDEYVPKPVVFRNLVDVMLRLLPHKALRRGIEFEQQNISRTTKSSPASSMTQPSQTPPAPKVSSTMDEDRQKALYFIGGNQKLLARLDAVFASDAPKELEELKNALEGDNLEEAQRIAHRIKGAAQTLGLRKVSEAAMSLEGACTEASNHRMELFDTLKKDVQGTIFHLDSP